MYGMGGELLAEYNPTGNVIQKEYGYRGGQLLVVAHQATQGLYYQYNVTDHLGSTRMSVTDTGSLTNLVRRDFLPFGEELTAGVGLRGSAGGYYSGNDGMRQKFTGYERDVEINLDFAQARSLSNSQGRFTSVDPFMGSGRLLVPQSFNRYSYVINNPLRYTDEDGLDWYINEAGNVEWYTPGNQPTGFNPFTPQDNQYNVSDTQSVILNPTGPNQNGQTQEERQGWKYGPHIDSAASGMVVMAGVTTVAQPEGPGEIAAVVLLIIAAILIATQTPTPTALPPPAFIPPPLTTTVPPTTLPAPLTNPNIEARKADLGLIDYIADKYKIDRELLSDRVHWEKQKTGRGGKDNLGKKKLEELAKEILDEYGQSQK